MALLEKLKSIKLEKNIAGILLMLTHAFAMSVIYVLGKKMGHSLGSSQLTFLYKFSILFVVIPWCMMGGGLVKNLKTNKLGLHITRSAFSTIAHLCFFCALVGDIDAPFLNQSDVAAVTYLENIIVVGIGILYFKEQFTHAKVLLIFCSILGGICITKPWIGEFNIRYLFLFLTLIFWALNNLSVKILGKTERGRPQLFYNMLVGSFVSLPFAIRDWKPIEFGHFKYLVALVIAHFIHNISFYKSYKLAEISTVMPFDYSRLVFTGALSYIFFNQIPDDWSIVGYAIVAAGGIYVIRHEAKLNKLPRS